MLDRFIAADVPALGASEAEVKPLTGKPQPEGLPGKGMAQHPMLYIGEGYNKIYLVNRRQDHLDLLHRRRERI